MTRKWVIAGLLAATLVGTAVGVRQLVAKDEAKADEPKKVVEEIVSKLKQQDYAPVFALAEDDHKKVLTEEERRAAPESKADIVAAMLKKQLAVAPLGSFTGEVEVAGREALGTSYVRYLLLQRFDRNAVVWKATFYRSARGWVMIELGWDDKVLSYLKPAAP